MKTAKDWLDAYGVSHTNEVNILIHKVCVPLIMFSIIGIFSFMNYSGSLLFSLATLINIFALIFYFKLGAKVFSLMFIQIAIMMTFVHLFQFKLSTYIGIFIISWVLQFIGHKIEGQKPSFIEDLQFLLIGPVWVFNRLLKI